jgi:hypothetical protein
LIAPNAQSYNTLKEDLTQQSFLNSDIFASFLKLDSNPTPSKEDFIKFCKLHNLGTIYLVVKDMYYIIDAKSFVIIDKQSLTYKSTKQEEPFYTKVDAIQKNTFSWFESGSIGNYTQYYSSVFKLNDIGSQSIDTNIVEDLDNGFMNGYLKVLGL